MPAAFPLLFIAFVFVFISTHAATSAKPKKIEKSPADDLAKAFEKVIKDSNRVSSEAKGKSK